MNRGRSLSRYRSVDLFLWALLLVLFETLIIVASVRWFPGQPYTVSLVPALTAVVMVRWGPWAALHAALGGAVVCAAQGASLPQYAVYLLGNLLSLAALPLFSRYRKEKGVFPDSLSALLFGLAVLLLMQAGRFLVLLAQGSAPSLAFGCFTTEAVTDLFTLVILWIVRRLDGVLEDQVHYFRRIQAEEKA